MAQAQNRPIKRLAEAQAKTNVESYSTILLQVVGHRDVKVAASLGKNITCLLNYRPNPR